MNVKDLMNNPQKVDKICKTYFDSIDKNRNGVLEFQEISKILAKFAEENDSLKPPEEEIKDAFNQLDTNNDGKISFSEFKRLFNKYLVGMANQK